MKPKNTLAISISTVEAFCKHECPGVGPEICKECPFPHSPARMRQKNWDAITHDPDAPTFFSAVREG